MRSHHPTRYDHTTSVVLLIAISMPLGWSLWGALAAGLDTAAWAALVRAPQTFSALGTSLWTGMAATALATAATAWMLATTAGELHGTRNSDRLTRLLSPLLAVPHAAFAIGLLALLAPSGWLLRLLSPWATGLTEPPPWPTTQDPWGLGLIAVLVCKEVPFLLWAALAHLHRPDVARRLEQELRLARTLGYSPAEAWWRVGWPQLLPRLAAPLLAVLAYGLTVVDVALIIGPTTPPPLAVLAWQWLQDADPAVQTLGAVAAWLLAILMVVCAAIVWGLLRFPIWRQRWVRGATTRTIHTHAIARRGGSVWLVMVYGAVMLALLFGSLVGPWPFPNLWPDTLTWTAWVGVWRSSGALWTTLWLAWASGLAALLWALAWLEWAPGPWQRRAHPWLMMPLILPAVLWVVGLHRLSLAWGLDTSGVGLWLAHTLSALPYVLIALQGPYQGFDPRLRHVSASLGHRRAAFLLRVKWPLLRSAIAASLAIGFAVSVAQYLPTLYVGAGRFTTVTTEAVNLAAGGQRSLTAAFAWLQWLLPVLMFALAARMGRTRRF